MKTARGTWPRVIAPYVVPYGTIRGGGGVTREGAAGPGLRGVHDQGAPDVRIHRIRGGGLQAYRIPVRSMVDFLVRHSDPWQPVEVCVLVH